MEDRLKKILAAVFGIDSVKIGEDTSAMTVEEWDSLKHISLILALEEEFNLEFNNNEVVEMMSFSSIKEVIVKKMKELE